MQNTRRKEATSARRPAARAPRRPPPTGPDALRGYLEKHELSHAAFADQIGVTRSHVGMLLGGSPPSLSCAVRIEQLTGIKCSDWVEAAA
jgi:plasmid maintenance system antidote protein VapI